jgi:hypothetical protein
MSGTQVLGLLVGAFLGWVIGLWLTGGKYRYVGGPYVEQTKRPMGRGGCLVQIVLAAIGASVGFFVTKP